MRRVVSINELSREDQDWIQEYEASEIGNTVRQDVLEVIQSDHVYLDENGNARVLRSNTDDPDNPVYEAWYLKDWVLAANDPQDELAAAEVEEVLATCPGLKVRY